jgi:hypothetical protein
MSSSYIIYVHDDVLLRENLNEAVALAKDRGGVVTNADGGLIWPRPEIRANPRCRNCLGSGRSMPIFAVGWQPVCSCVTEQIVVLTVPKDYSIQERYSPGLTEFREVRP